MNDHPPIPCPVCGKSAFPDVCDHNICKYCGWENDDCYTGGGANELSLEEHKKRYEMYIAMNADYVWCFHGYPEISEQDRLDVDHRFCSSNEEAILRSKKCGCFYCMKIFDSDEIASWISDNAGRTALCPYCNIDAVLPDSEVAISEEYLQRMHARWFEGVPEM